MGLDRDWQAVNEVVQAGLDDAQLLENPPASRQELEDLASTLTDHLVAALARGDLVKRPER